MNFIEKIVFWKDFLWWNTVNWTGLWKLDWFCELDWFWKLDWYCELEWFLKIRRILWIDLLLDRYRGLIVLMVGRDSDCDCIVLGPVLEWKRGEPALG